MQVPQEQLSARRDVETDGINRKLRGAVSMLLMLYGDGRQAFHDLTDEYKDGFIDTLVDLTEDARRLSDCR